MNKLPWKPWHEVVKLRDDLRSGELPLQPGVAPADVFPLSWSDEYDEMAGHAQCPP